MEQLPELLFELPLGGTIETVLRNIGMGFQALINSSESIELHRLMVTLGNQDPKLSKLFFDAGPQQILNEMERLLIQADKAGKLRIDKPINAAEHFFCLIKGGQNFRLLIGCGAPLEGEEAEQHVQEVVELFLRAYGTEITPPHEPDPCTPGPQGEPALRLHRAERLDVPVLDPPGQRHRQVHHRHRRSRAGAVPEPEGK